MQRTYTQEHPDEHGGLTAEVEEELVRKFQEDAAAEGVALQGTPRVIASKTTSGGATEVTITDEQEAIEEAHVHGGVRAQEESREAAEEQQPQQPQPQEQQPEQ